jgi:drug/metabolite transporter (DMT)-like permease
MSRKHATAIGFSAVLMWALLALLTVGSAPVPPFQLNAICFAIGGVIGLVWTTRGEGAGALISVRWPVYIFGTAGLFGYHALYFSALRLAPPAEAGLIAYLWPLLIVLLSGLLPGEKLRAGHLAGAALAFGGAALIILRGSEGFGSGALAGYALAGLCALTWSSYSVVSRRLGDVPTETVAVFCIASALLSAAAHLVFETAIWPDGAVGWLSVLGLGLGPVGLAFYVWDLGVKKGDIQLLGVASYAAPLLSTLALIGAGVAAASWSIVLAAILIAAGAALAAWSSRQNHDQA